MSQLAAFLNKAGDEDTAESLAGAVLDDEMADGNAVVRAAETLLAVRGAEAVPRVLLTVDRWSESVTYEDVWDLSRMLKQLAPYPEAAVVSRVSVLLERFASIIGAHDLIDAWLAVEPAGESILDAIDRGAMLYIYDQAWSAQHFQVAGAQAVAAELAERALRPRKGKYRDHYKRAASVLLKADRAAAVPQLVRWAAQNPEPTWLAGVMDALDDTDPEVERAGAFCARELVAHLRVDGKELRDALGILLSCEGELAAHSVAEAARVRPELGFNQRRQLACALAAVGQLELARSVWAHLLTWQGYGDWEDVRLIDDVLNAGVERWAADRIRDLIDDPATALLRVQRLRQMLAWLTAASTCSSS